VRDKDLLDSCPTWERKAMSVIHEGDDAEFVTYYLDRGKLVGACVTYKSWGGDPLRVMFGGTDADISHDYKTRYVNAWVSRIGATKFVCFYKGLHEWILHNKGSL